MSSLFLCSVFIFKLTITFTWAAQNFVEVSDCPKNANEWDMRSKKKNCVGDSLVYLCAAIENKLGRYGEICTNQRWIPENQCIVLNAQTYNLDSVHCKADTGCPPALYLPSNLSQYQICYGDFYGTTTTLAPIITPNITSAAASSGSENEGAGSGAGVAVAVVISLAVVVVIVVFYRRNQCGFRDKVRQLYTGLRQRFLRRDHRENVQFSDDAENGEAQSSHVRLLVQDVKDVKENETNSEKTVYTKPEQTIPTKKEKVTNTSDTKEGHKGKHDEIEKKIAKLEELLKYLVHILKQELDVNDLKEKVVIHSKSINEHFSEPLIKDLQSLKDINDYSRLDMSLVLTLLRNFCEGIKPSNRGWDYEPPDDETHVGADIERIRFMWNKHCDDDFEFKHLDDVYNRMKLKYSTDNTEVMLGGDGNQKPLHKYEKSSEGLGCMKKKIPSKLNEDCTVKEGIVITENITNALKILKSRNVVILKGVIGCGKTHALKAIKNHFQERKWKMEWVESENFEGEISHEKPTILLWDNLFGKFGASVFSQDAVNKTEKALKEIESSTKQETKVVIGIHTHVYDEVKKNFQLKFLHQKNITIEMDNLSEAEALLIFKEQLKKGHCKMDPNCWFKTVGFRSVLDRLSKNQGHIGGPFLSLMYCNQHELFSDEAFSVNCIPTLTQFFKKMKHDSTKLYDCLVYLMCVQQHNCEEEPKKWAGFISVDITKGNLEDLSKTSCLLQVENKITTLAHELLTIVLFRSAIANYIICLPVLQVCESDVFLQLLRPSDNTHSSGLYYEYMYGIKEPSRDVGKMCAYRLTQINEKQKVVHPLMAVEFVKEKYLNYLKHEPKHLIVIKGLM